MTSVPRLIKFWESMSSPTVSWPHQVVATAGEPERHHVADTSPCTRDHGSSSVLCPSHVRDRREPCSCPPGLATAGEVGAKASRRPRCVRKNTLFSGLDPFWNFPYRGAGLFRERLLSKRATVDTEYLLTEVCARLGPSECSQGDENLLGLERELGSEILTVQEPSNPYTVLGDSADDMCLRSRGLGGKAANLVKWFKALGLPQIGDPPPSISCGGLRSAVRQCFSDVDPVWELSFKTVAKVERSCCKSCLPRFEEKLSSWKASRVEPRAVNDDHLSRFRDAFGRNVDRGWDSRRRPFVPNGNATRSFTRRDGGNWNVEEFSSEFRTELVFSSGKPRVVTVYSSRNTEVLAPLHYSLYDSLKRKGWLLVGDPTTKHINKLNGAKLLSFDYSSATDNIKTAYVRSAISVLIEKSENLSDSELACLDVLGGLSLDGVECGSGQPMGSVMSFPLLCLINKTVVDLAMDSLLESGSISFPEWSSHRLLINGDDLLTREVRKDTDLRVRIAREGSEVGLVVNDEKTMSSETMCEINSTLFDRGIKVRKFNAAAVWMDPGVEDVLGFAAEASPSVRVFRKVVRWNANILAKSKDKHLAELPAHLQVVCRKDKKIRGAITSLPKSDRPTLEGVIKMAVKPEGYDLKVSEEHQVMSKEICRVREMGVAWASARAARKQFRTVALPNQVSYSSVLKQRRAVGQDLIPACYVRAYHTKLQDALVEEYVAVSSSESLPPGDGSKISSLIDNMRLFNQKRAVRNPGTIDASADFVSLD